MILDGSVKILKHSARFSLHVIVGLKVISLSVSLAALFLIFLVLVNKSPSGGVLSHWVVFGRYLVQSNECFSCTFIWVFTAICPVFCAFLACTFWFWFVFWVLLWVPYAC